MLEFEWKIYLPFSGHNFVVVVLFKIVPFISIYDYLAFLAKGHKNLKTFHFS